MTLPSFTSKETEANQFFSSNIIKTNVHHINLEFFTMKKILKDCYSEKQELNIIKF